MLCGVFLKYGFFLFFSCPFFVRNRPFSQRPGKQGKRDHNLGLTSTI